MVLIFVYVMTFYNAGMENGVTFSTFGYALKNMWVEVIGAFIAQRYIASKIVKKLVARIFDENDKPVFKLLATAGFTVSLMAPIMTFYVSFYHLGFSSEFLGHWLSKLVLNFLLPYVLKYFMLDLWCAGYLDHCLKSSWQPIRRFIQRRWIILI